MEKDGRKLIALLTGIFAVFVIVLLLLFSTFVNSYKTNIASESANHLVEINKQAVSYIQLRLGENDSIVRSVAANLDGTNQDQAAVSAYLARQEGVWHAKSLRVYTNSGLCIDQNGIAQSKDQAAKTVLEMRSAGNLFSINASTIEYGIPVNSTATINGSAVAAVSVTQDLDSLIDSMDVKAFDGYSALYITTQNGVKISQTSTSSNQVYNVASLFDEGTVTCLTDSGMTLQSAMESGVGEVFFRTKVDASAHDYIVMTPMSVMGQTWYLFYEVPAAEVNSTMDGFTSYVTTLSAVVMVIFFALLALFFFIYRKRTKGYVHDIKMRERLLNLLVSETDNAFVMLSKDKAEPLYETENAADLLRGVTMRSDAATGSFRLAGSGQLDAATLTAVNEALAGWDGTSDFTSDYLPCHTGEKTRYMLLKIYPVHDNSREYIGVARDATSEVEREQELNKALASANSANQAKTKFLSSMSHDIRTPMNAIVNMTDFAIASVDDSQETVGYLEVIKDSSLHLLQLINNVLDMSRIESGKIAFASDPFDLQDILREVGEIIRPLCGERAQSFTVTCTDMTDTHLIGDGLRLSQILINLLNNAVKFTPEKGKIGLIVTELPSLKPETAAYRFAVADNGIGMDEETAKTVFDPFVRANGETVRSIEGTGLGLSIAKNFVEAMCGSIGVESALGEGSTFTLELSFAIDESARAKGEGKKAVSPTEEDLADDPSIRFDGYRVLLVEDNAVNQMVASKILTDWGMAVDTADDGRQAVDRYLAEPAGTYDMIFMDIQMPLMSGYEATRAIRDSQRDDAEDIPILAMTANVFAEDIERARHAGMNGHVGKPIQPPLLKSEIAKHLQPR